MDCGLWVWSFQSVVVGALLLGLWQAAHGGVTPWPPHGGWETGREERLGPVCPSRTCP